MRRRIVILNFVLTLLITMALLIVPVYENRSSRRDGLTGRYTESRTRLTLLQVNGPLRTLSILVVPLALSVVPMFSIRRARISGILLLIFALLGGASVGLWYIPGAAILLFAGGET